MNRNLYWQESSGKGLGEKITQPSETGFEWVKKNTKILLKEKQDKPVKAQSPLRG